jgi:mannose-6-phosphate isomerase-like protein (cupin superfamily)
MGKRPSLVVVVVLLGLVLGSGRIPAPSLAQNATPEAVSPPVITSELLGRAVPAAVEKPELALARVTVMPGAVLPVHHHPGTQIGVVVQGELTYTVFTGEIKWYRSDAATDEPRIIGPGETVVVGVGEALVESPDSIHQGRNNSSVPLVIYLSTLFPAGAPRAIVVEATPGP